MKAECGGFLQAAVLETVLRLLESKQSAELNPAKMDSPVDACSNAEFLLQILDQVKEMIKTLIFINLCVLHAQMLFKNNQKFTDNTQELPTSRSL